MAVATALLAAYALLIRPGLERSAAGGEASEIAVIQPAEAAEPPAETGTPIDTAAAASDQSRLVRADRLIGCIERAEGHFETIDRCHAAYAAAD